MLRGPLLAATDLSEGADAALRQAADLAADLATRLIVCYVLPESVGPRHWFHASRETDARRHDELASAIRARVSARIAQTLGGFSGELTVAMASGSPHAGILDEAHRRGAGAIVVGSGPTALRVSRSADCPVLVARPSPTGGSVLGATDFSDPALPAVRAAAAEAARRGVGLRLVHCLDLDHTSAIGVVTAPGMPGAVALPPIPDDALAAIESAAHERLAAALADIGTTGDGVVSRRAPLAGILDAADAAATSLIVVGSRGRTGLVRLALGSVAEAVVSRASCSVLVVPLQPEPVEPASRVA
ncbi:MAG: universal stress protein [Acidobacteriota bacterium]